MQRKEDGRKPISCYNDYLWKQETQVYSPSCIFQTFCKFFMLEERLYCVSEKQVSYIRFKKMPPFIKRNSRTLASSR